MVLCEISKKKLFRHQLFSKKGKRNFDIVPFSFFSPKFLFSDLCWLWAILRPSKPVWDSIVQKICFRGESHPKFGTNWVYRKAISLQIYKICYKKCDKKKKVFFTKNQFGKPKIRQRATFERFMNDFGFTKQMFCEKNLFLGNIFYKNL